MSLKVVKSLLTNLVAREIGSVLPDDLLAALPFAPRSARTGIGATAGKTALAASQSAGTLVDVVASDLVETEISVKVIHGRRCQLGSLIWALEKHLACLHEIRQIATHSNVMDSVLQRHM
jgi:hypothetical protein